MKNGRTDPPLTKLQVAKGKQNHLLTPDEWEKSIVKCYGVIAWIARDLGISYQGVVQKLSYSPDLKKKQIEAHEIMLDKGEEILIQKMEQGDFDAVKFILSHQGKDRGWGDSTDLNVRSMNLNVDVNLMENMSPEELEIWNEQHKRLLNQANPE
jgi:hypothetical protein